MAIALVTNVHLKVPRYSLDRGLCPRRTGSRWQRYSRLGLGKNYRIAHSWVQLEWWFRQVLWYWCQFLVSSLGAHPQAYIGRFLQCQ